MRSRILLVEDDARYASRLKKNLELEEYEVRIADSGEAALQVYSQEPVDLVLSDIKMPGMDGLDLLKRLMEPRGEEELEIPIMFLTSVDSARVAVEAMKAGAADYITKDSDRDEILLRIEKVLASAKMRAENRRLRKHIQETGEFGDLVAVDPKSQAILSEIESIADTGAGILIVGETGVGKELIARYIHKVGSRRNQPFIDVNCAALPNDNLFQSEVFGHEKGAFTGATQRKPGKLELADQGTLFLDEIGDMPLESQGKILRALETQEFERLGGSQKIKVDIAVIAATNKELHREVLEGRFRQDLLYRLDIIRLEIPPLRERIDDIYPLTLHFLALYAGKYRCSVPTVTEAARTALESYSWPGNVRELKNLIERIVIRNRRCEVIDESLLRPEGFSDKKNEVEKVSGVNPTDSEILPLEEIEKRAILAALERSGWKQTEAAKLLQISPDRMHARIKKFGIHHPSWRIHRNSE